MMDGFVFFFQAEDGIRDTSVTGVQTCALPISKVGVESLSPCAWQEPGTRRQAFYTDLRPGKYQFRVIACNNDSIWNERSEERRVGKECRARGPKESEKQEEEELGAREPAAGTS